MPAKKNFMNIKIPVFTDAKPHKEHYKTKP